MKAQNGGIQTLGQLILGLRPRHSYGAYEGVLSAFDFESWNAKKIELILSFVCCHFDMKQ